MRNFLFLTLVVAGCSGKAVEPTADGAVDAGLGEREGSTPSADASSSVPSCVSGDAVTCACAGGATGAQVCQSDGTYGECVCTGAIGWDGGYVSDAGFGGGDSAALVETSAPVDGGFPLPTACGNPGPFSGQISSAVVGMWIYCNHSLFGDFGATNDVGVVFRANGTWQRLGASGGNLYYLGLYVDYGTWSTYGNGMVLVNVNGGGLALGPEISVDGNTMYVTSPSSADKTVLAKVVDSVSGDAEPPLGVPEVGGGDGGVE